MGQPYNIPISEKLFNELKDWIQYNMTPENIFEHHFLHTWAIENGYDKSQRVNGVTKIFKDYPAGSYNSYPFPEMKVGDSFFVEQKRSTFYYAVQWWLGRTTRGYGQKYSLKTLKNGTICCRIK